MNFDDRKFGFFVLCGEILDDLDSYWCIMEADCHFYFLRGYFKTLDFAFTHSCDLTDLLWYCNNWIDDDLLAQIVCCYKFGATKCFDKFCSILEDALCTINCPGLQYYIGAVIDFMFTGALRLQVPDLTIRLLDMKHKYGLTSPFTGDAPEFTL